MIFDATVCKLGEGPLWHPERGVLFWFDILRGQLHWQEDGATRAMAFAGHDYASAAGRVDRDTLLVATNRALLRVDLETGDFDEVVPLEADNPVTRSNDGRADPQGGFWIGTMGINAEPGAGAIYRYWRGDVRRLFADIQISNAICFAPDGGTAHFTDTNTQRIMAVALDADGWPAGAPRVHIDLTGTDFRPDGAVVDARGHLWNAQWGVGRVAEYDRDGRFVQAIDLPATQTSCPAFGGADLSTLYVTSAAVGLGARAREDGKTFVVPTSTAGQAEHRVIL